MRSFLKNLSSHKSFNVLLWIIFIIPFVIYGITIFRYAVNIPVIDDFDIVLNTMITYVRAQDLEGRLTVLFAQHNEHRLVFDRLVFFIYYSLFHEANLRFFIMFGNLGWILTTLLLVIYSRKTLQRSLVSLLPIPYIMLSFIHRDTMSMASSAIQFYWCIFFSVAFLLCLSKDRPLLFCVLFPVALFTSGAGIVLYPLGIIFLALRRRWKSFLIFFVLATLFVVLYFYNYSKPASSPSLFAIVLEPVKSIAYFFSFLGNILPVNTISIPIGIILFILSILFFIKRPGDSFLQLIICFVGLTALLATITRSGFGIWQAGSARYTMFPLIAFLCIYIFIVISISRSTSTYKFVVACALLCALAYWGSGVVYSESTHYFQKEKDQRIASLVGFRMGNKESLIYPEKDRAAQILLTAQQLHIYNYLDQIP